MTVIYHYHLFSYVAWFFLLLQTLYKGQIQMLKEEVDEKMKACSNLDAKHKALESEKYGTRFSFY